MTSFKAELSLKTIGVIEAVAPNLDTLGRREYTVRTVYEEEPTWVLVFVDPETGNLPISIGDLISAYGPARVKYRQENEEGPFNPDDLYVELYNPEIHILRAT